MLKLGRYLPQKIQSSHLKRQWWKVGGGEGNSQGCAERKILVSPRSSNLWNPDCLEFCHPWANLSKLPPAIGNCCKSTDLIVNNNNYCLRVIFCVIQNNQGRGGLITLPKPWLLRIQWNPSFGSPLFKGHIHSGDTKFGPRVTPT